MSEKNQDTQTVEIDKALLHELLTFSASELRHVRRSRFITNLIRILLGIVIVSASMYITNKKVIEDGQIVTEPHIASISIEGEIASSGPSDADKLIPAIRKAMEAPNAKGVILKMNSPGGSPVQADRFYTEITKLRKDHPNKKIYAVVEDLCASACYYIASATDEIYVNRSSIVGSIGVITSGFGFTGLMDKLGVERRVMTAGENKALMDQFSPLKPEIRDYWTKLLAETHKTFIGAVKDGRGPRLKTDTEGLFSGLLWGGTRSIEIGLADKIGSSSDISTELLDGKVNVINYTPMPDFLKRFGMSAETFVGHSLAIAFQQTLSSSTPAMKMEVQ